MDGGGEGDGGEGGGGGGGGGAGGGGGDGGALDAPIGSLTISFNDAAEGTSDASQGNVRDILKTVMTLHPEHPAWSVTVPLFVTPKYRGVRVIVWNILVERATEKSARVLLRIQRNEADESKFRDLCEKIEQCIEKVREGLREAVRPRFERTDKDGHADWSSVIPDPALALGWALALGLLFKRIGFHKTATKATATHYEQITTENVLHFLLRDEQLHKMFIRLYVSLPESTRKVLKALDTQRGPLIRKLLRLQMTDSIRVPTHPDGLKADIPDIEDSEFQKAVANMETIDRFAAAAVNVNTETEARLEKSVRAKVPDLEDGEWASLLKAKRRSRVKRHWYRKNFLAERLGITIDDPDEFKEDALRTMGHPILLRIDQGSLTQIIKRTLKTANETTLWDDCNLSLIEARPWYRAAKDTVQEHPWVSPVQFANMPDENVAFILSINLMPEGRFPRIAYVHGEAIDELTDETNSLASEVQVNYDQRSSVGDAILYTAEGINQSIPQHLPEGQCLINMFFRRGSRDVSNADIAKSLFALTRG